MDKADLLLIIAGASIGASVQFSKLWQKIICAVIGLIIIYIVGAIRKKEELDKELNKVIANDDKEESSKVIK